ncbi:MAG: hypothetical protein QOG80_2137 [Pseudonocardiales bacterium]|nr:hypothetical protein [Pseudonocardiales bacterium]
MAAGAATGAGASSRSSDEAPGRVDEAPGRVGDAAGGGDDAAGGDGGRLEVASRSSDELGDVPWSDEPGEAPWWA